MDADAVYRTHPGMALTHLRRQSCIKTINHSRTSFSANSHRLSVHPFLKSVLESGNGGQAAIRFGVYAVGDRPKELPALSWPIRRCIVSPSGPIMSSTAVIAPARKHGLIRQTPQNLRQIIDVMKEVDVDLLSILRQRLRQWKEQRCHDCRGEASVPDFPQTSRGRLPSRDLGVGRFGVPRTRSGPESQE